MRLALAAMLLLSASALADESCAADGTWHADEDDNAALLQKSAAHKAEVAEHSHADADDHKSASANPLEGCLSAGADCSPSSTPCCDGLQCVTLGDVPGSGLPSPMVPGSCFPKQ